MLWRVGRQGVWEMRTRFGVILQQKLLRFGGLRNGRGLR